jgi:hypothetical protein
MALVTTIKGISERGVEMPIKGPSRFMKKPTAMRKAMLRPTVKSIDSTASSFNFSRRRSAKPGKKVR